MKWLGWSGILLVTLLTGCQTVQKIERNHELLKDFQTPAGEVLNPTLVLESEADSVTLGAWKAVKTSRRETPDFWTGAFNELFTKADLKRVVTTYELRGAEGTLYRLNVINDLYRSKNGDGSSWMLRKPELVSASSDQKLGLEYSHTPGGEVLAKFTLGDPVTVKLYYNGIARSGGWTDLFNSPTALVIDGEPGRTYLQLVGPKRLLESDGRAPSDQRTQTALLLGYLLLQSEAATREELEWSVR